MNHDQEIRAIFRELSPENQERLLDNARLSWIAENTVKKGMDGRNGAAAGREYGPVGQKTVKGQPKNR
jgi:hypothetical protein